MRIEGRRNRERVNLGMRQFQGVIEASKVNETTDEYLLDIVVKKKT